MAFISNSIARMVFGAQHEETTSRTVASAVSGHPRQSLSRSIVSSPSAVASLWNLYASPEQASQNNINS